MDTNTVVTCPICLAHLDAEQVTQHWSVHVRQIPSDAAEHAGAFTWDCACGPTMMTWVDDAGASAGLALHMQMRHNIPV